MKEKKPRKPRKKKVVETAQVEPVPEPIEVPKEEPKSGPDLSLYEGIRPEKLPRVWYSHYVVYKYNWSNTYIVGFNSDVEAHQLQTDLLRNKELVRCEIFGHYPRELLEDKNG